MSDPSERIIAHMNQDHQLALSDYLVHYSNLSPSDFKQESAQITKIDLKSLEISYKTSLGRSSTETIVWSKVLDGGSIDSWGDIKGKLVSMAKISAAGQGYSHQKVDKVLLPGASSIGAYILEPALAYAIYDLNGFKRLLKLDSFLQAIIKRLPAAVSNVAEFAGRKAGVILGTILVVHVLELIFYTYPLLAKHRVPFKQRVAWTFMALVEGFPSIFRFNSLLHKQ